MPRDWIINGETLVRVLGGAHLSGGVLSSGNTELGLAVGEVTVSPIFKHKDVVCDDFGPDVPAEILTQLAEVRIGMTLVHYDREALDVCMTESLAGRDISVAGTLAPAGTPLGKGLALYASGCHFMQVNLESPQLNQPWSFKACYLPGQPLQIPLGTTRTAAVLDFRCIPYARPNASGEVSSSGVVLWNNTPDDV